MVSTKTKYIFELFLKDQNRFVVKKISPMQEYKENMNIYMPNSVATNFHEHYELSEEEINDIRLNSNFHKEKTNQNTQIYNKYSIPIKPLQEKVIAEPSLNNKIYKTKRAPEGLDKIKIILNPYYINLENKSDKLCSHNELTLHKGGPFRMVSIHAEFINHKQDIHISLARAVYHLIEKGIYNIEFLKGVDKYKAIYFIFKHLNYFIILISEVEFYFNIRRENIVVKKEAIIYGYLRKIQDKERRGTSYYSKDYNEKYGRNSSAIIYDRYEKLIKDNQTSHKILNKMKYKTRIELKLFNVSTDWIHIDNFKGTYRRIFNRYFYFLTILYKKFIKDYILINSSENRYLDKIVKGASIIDKIRFANQDNKLSQQGPIDKNKMSLTKITNNEKEMAIIELKILFDDFSETIDTTNEYTEFKELLLNKNNERHLNIK
jgi:hypothetical protein